MDELQLRMKVPKVELIADALESHVMTGDAQEHTAELTELVTYLRYRLAKIGHTRAIIPAE